MYSVYWLDLCSRSSDIHQRGAFHYAKDSGKLGRKSNGKVCFSSFQPEYSGPYLPFHFDKPVHCLTCRHLCRDLEKE